MIDLRRWSFVISIVLALAFTTVILLAAGAPPLEAYRNILAGALESPAKRADVLVAVVPLLLCAIGLLLTFTAGLWNIGVEGQIMAGAVFGAWVARSLTLPPVLLLALLLLAGMIGGALWGALAGLLKVYGNVHEIFGGLGLTFVAAASTNYLIFGPWKPADGATMSGTDPFQHAAWLPRLGNLRMSPPALILSLIALVIVFLVLRNTMWGLKLKAVGQNVRSAFLLGIPTHRQMMLAFALCGALAGLAGAIQTAAVYRRLIPQISGGYGYLSLLVVWLAGTRAVWILPVALFFAIVGVGSPRLELRMQLDSSLGGILEASIVLCFILVRGVASRLTRR